MALSDYTRSSSDFLTIQDLQFDQDRNRAIAGFEVTISDVGTHQFDNDPAPRLVLYFAGKQKGLNCNLTNARMLETLFPDVKEERDLIGKQVKLYVDPSVTNKQGQVVGGLRITASMQPDPTVDAENPF